MNLKAKSKNFVVIVLMLFAINQNYKAQNTKNDFKTGADQPEKYLPLLKNKRVGVVTNQTGLITETNGKTISIVDFLKEKGINIKKIFVPEHGFRGTADAGEQIKNGIDTKTALPIVSLYGKNKKPTAEQMKDIEVVLFDLQDVGVRFYTYISTLTYVMEAAAENGVEVIVLDRPNPHDGYIDGPVLKPKWASFVGLHPVPVVYGEGWLKNKIKAKYTLIPMQGYSKQKRYPILEKPSPNLQNDKAVNLYPSLCFFEGTNVSVGRGTDLPFQIYGSPWITNASYRFTPKPSFGAKNPFLNGQECFGENLSGYDKDLRELNLEWVLRAYKNYKNPKEGFFLKNLWFDTLAGTDELRKQIVAGKSAQEIRNSWKKDLEAFQKIRAKYILYKD